jgi:hypothetical protein
MLPVNLPPTPRKSPKAQGAFLRATVKPEDSAPLGTGVSFLPICLGQEYHIGQKLQAIVDLLQRSEHIIVLISGVLYRHTLQITHGLSIEDAINTSMQNAAEWEQQNISILNTSRTPMTIYRWESWLLHERYEDFRAQLEEHYINDRTFKDAFDNDATAFLDRLSKKYEIRDRSKAFLICLKYLKEECAVFITMAKSGSPFGHFVYPGSKSTSIDMTFRKFSLPVSWRLVEFKSTNDPIVQHVHPKAEMQARLASIMRLEDQNTALGDRTEVLTSSRVFLLKGAITSIRDAAARDITTKLMQAPLGLQLHKYEDQKTTLLIFSAAGKYAPDKFSGDLWKNYLPTRKLEANQMLDMLDSSGIFNLVAVQQQQSALYKRILETLPENEIPEAQLTNVTAALNFFYALLVYKGVAPEARLLNIAYEFYFAEPNSACSEAERNTALNEINKYLSDAIKTYTSNPIIVADNLQLAANVAPIKVIRIVNAKVLLQILSKIHDLLPQSRPTSPASRPTSPSLLEGYKASITSARPSSPLEASLAKPAPIGQVASSSSLEHQQFSIHKLSASVTFRRGVSSSGVDPSSQQAASFVDEDASSKLDGFRLDQP